MTDVAPVEDWSWECPQDPHPPSPPTPPPLPVMYQAPLSELSLQDLEDEAETKLAVTEELARHTRYSALAPHLRYSQFDVTIPIRDHLNGKTCPVVGINCKGARSMNHLKEHLLTQKHMEQALEREALNNPVAPTPEPTFRLVPTVSISFSAPTPVPSSDEPELDNVSGEEMELDDPETPTPPSSELPPLDKEREIPDSQESEPWSYRRDMVIPDSEDNEEDAL
ncbi:hypothetical protein NCS54_01506800 [Fusarium falciforme]|uniref:uncharacterized protein n=1 Tax=Fusarium falciforme TaxID=195108 RepID=UPI002301C847|nr:uncharacterized protein NCS54_01506800 [Fusarium falciforme]WAO97345.1 hypothetical protein NCS54_01506800 [Fusarium falciforme]